MRKFLGNWPTVVGVVLLAGLLATGGGCRLISRIGTDNRGLERGKTLYVGGAGPFGHVGTTSVPKGLREGGYRGAIEVFGWQSVLGGTLRDQIDVGRNKAEARRLADKIRAYHDEFPGRSINLIGLSAGTGIITWALEELPPEYRVGQVVFLGSSLSREYDLSEAFDNIGGVLWNFYSPRDGVLKYGVPLTGSVDRAGASTSLAGLHGFAPPADADQETRRQYRRRLRNMAWHPDYAAYGWNGNHTRSVAADFVASIVVVLLDPATETPATPSLAARDQGRAERGSDE